VAVLGLALALRVAYVLATPSYRPVYDAGDYVRIGLSLAHGHGFGPSVFVPGASAFRPPLYPAFLAGVFAVSGDSLTAARLAQAVLGTLGVALIGLVAWQLWGRRAGIVAAGLAAVLPTLVVLDGTLMSEVLFLPLMTGAVAAVLQVRRGGRPLPWSAAAGAVGALAVLARPNGSLLLAGLAIAVPIGFRGRWRAAATEISCLVLIAGAVIAPWVLRDAVVFRAFVPVTDSAGFDLAGIYNPVQEAAPEPLTGSWAYPPTLAPFRSLFGDAHLNEYQLTHHLQSSAVGYAEHHPAYVAEVLALNSWRILGGQPGFYEPASGRAIGVGARSVDAWYAGWLVLAGLGVAGLAVGRAGLRRMPGALWAVPLLLVLSGSQADGEARYRAPLEVFVVLVVAGAALPSHVRRSRRKGRSITP
jgi:4-amino-4-deoxy-L-arabinose transferase-like glycosyltransferase